MICHKCSLRKYSASCIAGCAPNCFHFKKVKSDQGKSTAKKEDSTATEKLKWFTYIAPGLAILAPLLYIVGFLYHEGYLEQFGLNAGDFPKTTQEYFIFSYYCFLIQSLKVFKWIIIFSVLFSVSLIPYVIIYCWQNRIENQIVDKYSSRLRGKIDKELVLAAISSWERLAHFVVAIIVVVLVIIFTALFAVKAGQDQAKLQQEKFQGCDQSASKTSGCTFLLENNKIIASGLVVARNGSHIALYFNGKTLTYPLKDYVVESYRNLQ